VGLEELVLEPVALVAWVEIHSLVLVLALADLLRTLQVY
jgi:hypothetical protein